MEGISHSINKTQLVKTLKSPIQAQEVALTAQSLARISWWLILGSLTAQVPPHTHTQHPSLAPDLEAAWGQPSNQIQTIVRCSLNVEAKDIIKQRSKGPRKTKKTPVNTESYTLKLTCTGYSELSRNPEQERERTPTPNTKEARSRLGTGSSPRRRGEQTRSPLRYAGGEILPKPRSKGVCEVQEGGYLDGLRTKKGAVLTT